MESFSWVSEGPSPLKETQAVKKLFLQMIKSRGTTRGPKRKNALQNHSSDLMQQNLV